MAAQLGAGQFILWKVKVQTVDGLTWTGTANLVFKASYGGREMFSEALRVAYAPGPVACATTYVFRDVVGCDAVTVQLFNGTPGDPKALVGKLAVDLREFRTLGSSTDAWLPIAASRARVLLNVTCTALADDEDEQASCMDAPGQEGKGDRCICQ